MNDSLDTNSSKAERAMWKKIADPIFAFLLCALIVLATVFFARGCRVVWRQVTGIDEIEKRLDALEEQMAKPQWQPKNLP